MAKLVRANVGMTQFQAKKLLKAMENNEPLTIKLKANGMDGPFPIMITNRQANRRIKNKKNGMGMAIAFNKTQLNAMTKKSGGILPLAAVLISALAPVAVSLGTKAIKGIIKLIRGKGGQLLTDDEIREIIFEKKGGQIKEATIKKIISSVRNQGSVLRQPTGSALRQPTGSALLPAGQFGSALRQPTGSALLPAGQFGSALRQPTGSGLPNVPIEFGALSQNISQPMRGNFMNLTQSAQDQTTKIFNPDPRDFKFTTEKMIQGGRKPKKTIQDLIDLIKGKGMDKLTDIELCNCILKCQKIGGQMSQSNIKDIIAKVRNSQNLFNRELINFAPPQPIKKRGGDIIESIFQIPEDPSLLVNPSKNGATNPIRSIPNFPGQITIPRSGQGKHKGKNIAKNIIAQLPLAPQKN